jgi:hypothetical protein
MRPVKVKVLVTFDDGTEMGQRRMVPLNFEAGTDQSVEALIEQAAKATSEVAQRYRKGWK